MLRRAICDDETDSRDSLRIQLEKIINSESEDIVYEFLSGERTVSFLKKHPGEIDLLFLDVEMSGINGMKTAGNIREFDKSLMIVFVTGYADYVFDGYQIGALDYLMKPVTIEKLLPVYKRVRELLLQNEGANFVLKNTEGLYRFPYEDILYFYSDRRLVNLVTAKGSYPFYGKLDVIEEKVGVSFVRIHQRYLVNEIKVRHIGNSSIIISGVGGETAELPVSRALKEAATEKLARAMLRG